MPESRTQQLHQQADLLLNSNRLVEARALYDRICSRDGSDAEAFMMRGALDGEMGRVEDALKSLNEAIRLDPGYADAYHTLAHLLRHQGKLTEARDALQAAVKIDPEFTEAWAMLSGLLGQLGEFAGSETASRRALALDPSLVDARANLANALVEQGREEEAIPELKQAAEQQPANAQIWSRLGTILTRTDRFDKAIPALENALRLNPADNETRTALGYAYHGNKAFAKATEQFHKVIESNPEEGQAWETLVRATEEDGWQALADYCEQLAKRFPGNRHVTLNHGYALEMLNDLDGACVKYEQLTREFSDWGNGWNRLGLLYTKLEKNRQALNCLEKAVEFGVDWPLTLCMYGSALRIYGNYIEAARYCRRAIEKAPDLIPAYIHLAMVQTLMGDLDLALETYHNGLELDPDNLTLVAGISDVLERQGKPEDAYQVLEPHLDSDGDGVAQIATMYANVSNRLQRSQQAALKLVEKTLARKDLTRAITMNLHFRAGDINHSLHQYDNAIEHYDKANALSELEFDRDAHIQLIDDTIAAFSDDVLAQMAGLGNTSSRPIFIVGMPRSGSSLAEQILASHPDVHGAGELMDFAAITQSLGFDHADASIYAARLASLTNDEIKHYAEIYLQSIDKLSNGERYVTDKLPHNFLRLGLIQILLPNAHIIHTRRDPMDSCLSSYFLDFIGTHPYAYDLENLGVYYREYERLMAHWHDVLSIPILDIQYEKAVENIEATCHRMVDFCELDWDERVVDFHESTRVVKTSSYNQVRRPVYKSSVGRWKPYEAWLDPLKKGLSGR